MKYLVFYAMFILAFADVITAQSNQATDLRIFFTLDGTGIINNSGEVIVKANFDSITGDIDSGCSCLMAKEKTGKWGVLA